jgi:hypothetical protein
MGDAKRIVVKPIAAADANRIVRALHYSGKVVNNSQLHLGVFMDGRCGGAMQFGPSLDKRKMLGLVTGTLWNEFIELNRMAFADWLPRNGESRAIGYAFRWMRKQYPHIKWCVSFADGTQCGDGTIYRASGFALTGIKENSELYEFHDGTRHAKSTFMDGANGGGILKRKYGFREGEGDSRFVRRIGARRLPGFQLRYIYFLDPTARDRLTVTVLPFSEIDRRGAGMYKGKPRTRAGSDTMDTPANPAGEGGSTPTPALQSPPGGEA